MDEGRGEDRTSLAPGPAVEEAGDGGEDDVAPIGEVIIGDVREAEENGGGPPAHEVALGRSRKHVLQQPAEEKFFGPRGEKENTDGEKRERLPLPPLRRKFDEVHGLAQRNGDTSENDET